MGRRSNEQICEDLIKERSRLYAHRNRLTKKLQNKKLQGKKRKEADKGWKKAQKGLDAIKVQLFRCGKKYSAFKKQRTKLRRHQRYLLDKVKAGGLSKKDLRKTYLAMRETAKQINQVENSMRLPVGKLKSSKVIGFVALKKGRFEDDNILWVLPSMFDQWLQSGAFDLLVLDDELIDIAANPIVAKIKVDLAIARAMAWQHLGATPKFYVYGDIPNGYLEIKVENYSPDLFQGV